MKINSPNSFYNPPTILPGYEDIAPFFFNELEVQVKNAVSMGHTEVVRGLNSIEQYYIKEITNELKNSGYTVKWKSPTIKVIWKV